MAWTQVFSDSFTGSNGTALSTHDPTWVDRFGDAEIQNNQAADGNGGSGSRVELDVALNDDQACEASVPDSANAAGLLLLRATHDNADLNGFNGYALIISAGFLMSLDRYDGGPGSAANIDSVFSFPLFEDNDTIRIEAEGTTIRGLINDVETVSGTDATYSSGKAGLIAVQEDGEWDDFVAEHVVAVITENVSPQVLTLFQASPTAVLTHSVGVQVLELAQVRPAEELIYTGQALHYASRKPGQGPMDYAAKRPKQGPIDYAARKPGQGPMDYKGPKGNVP